MANQESKFFSHQTLEKNIGLMIICSIVVVLFAGLVQIVPLFFQKSTTQPVPGLKPYDAVQLAGRDVEVEILEIVLAGPANPDRRLEGSGGACSHRAMVVLPAAILDE